MAFRVILAAAVLILLTQGDEGDDEAANSDRGSHAGAAALLRHSDTPRQSSNLDPITIVVKNNFRGVKKTYSASVAYRGILIGAMKRLRKSNADFKFTYKEDINYGPYLESINGVPGKTEDHTYWELLVIKPDGSTELDVTFLVPTSKSFLTLQNVVQRRGLAGGSSIETIGISQTRIHDSPMAPPRGSQLQSTNQSLVFRSGHHLLKVGPPRNKQAKLSKK